MQSQLSRCFQFRSFTLQWHWSGTEPPCLALQTSDGTLKSLRYSVFSGSTCYQFFKIPPKFPTFIWKFICKNSELEVWTSPQGPLCFRKHIWKRLQCFSSFFFFLNVNVQNVSVSFKFIWGPLSLLWFLWFRVQFYHECSWSILKASLWIISCLLVFCEASYFATELFLAWLLSHLIFQNHREPLLTQMEKW